MAKKMTLQERIKTIEDYFSSIEIKQTFYIMKIIYPEKWSAYSSDNGLINVAKAETPENIWFYYANVDEVELDDIFNLVSETIETNLSAEKKVELYKEKMYELKEIFEDRTNTLEKLKSLRFEFVTEKPKKRISAKEKRKKETAKEIEDFNNTEEKENTECLGG